jgi:hypothetical protein
VSPLWVRTPPTASSASYQTVKPSGVAEHAAALVAVAPPVVLDGGLADGAPKARRATPSRRPARSGRPGDRALVERVLRVLDGQSPPGGRVPGQRDVPRGVHRLRRCAHVGANDGAGVTDLQPGIAGDSVLRRHARCGNDKIAVDGSGEQQASPIGRKSQRRRRLTSDDYGRADVLRGVSQRVGVGQRAQQSGEPSAGRARRDRGAAPHARIKCRTDNTAPARTVR